MAMRDEKWKMDPCLEKSTALKLVGCYKFLKEKSEERKKELRMSR
jgi:hypothetical protein